MRNRHDAFQVLAQAAGLRELRTNADGHAEIIVEKVLRVYISEVDDCEIELSCRLHGFDNTPSSDVLREMLAANATLPGGRLSIEPASGTPVLCRRLDIAVLDADDLEQAFWTFLRDAAAWSTHLGRSLKETAQLAQATAAPDVSSEIYIRL